MALSTSELVVERISASFVGGLCGVGPTSTSSLEVGLGARLAEGWLVGPPDTVRILLFLPKCAKGAVILQTTTKLHDILFSYLYRGVSALIAFLLSLPNPDGCG